MWKLLPVSLLVSCTSNDQYQPDSVGHQSDHGRIVRQVELPVTSPAQNANGQPPRKNFQATGMQGWLDETGYWHIESEIHHGRLRCATYAAGLQFGKGNPACSDVEWLTGVDYATRLSHCNSATRLQKRLEEAAPFWRDTQLRLHPRGYYFDRERENANDRSNTTIPTTA